MAVVRWILAVIAGVVLYWVVMLMSLGVMAMIVENTKHVSEDSAAATIAHMNPLVGLALGLGSFAAVFVAIAIAPHKQLRIMGAVAVLAAAAWAIYGQIYAGSPMTVALIQAGAAIAGALAAYGLAQALFRPREGS